MSVLAVHNRRWVKRLAVFFEILSIALMMCLPMPLKQHQSFVFLIKIGLHFEGDRQTTKVE